MVTIFGKSITRELRVGDQGQRYEVRFISNSKECVAGWTDDKDGKPFVESINKHPVWHSPKVIDRESITTKGIT